jgi:hypothetical protein
MGSSLSSTLLKTRGVAEPNQNTRHIQADNLSLIKPELERLVREAATLTLENIAYK